MAMRRSRFQVKPNLKVAPKPANNNTPKSEQPSPKKIDVSLKKTVEDVQVRQTEKCENNVKDDRPPALSKNVQSGLPVTPQKDGAGDKTNEDTPVSEKKDSETSKTITGQNASKEVDQVSEKSSKPTTRFRMIKPKPKLVERTKTNPVNSSESVSTEKKNINTYSKTKSVSEEKASETVPTNEGTNLTALKPVQQNNVNTTKTAGTPKTHPENVVAPKQTSKTSSESTPETDSNTAVPIKTAIVPKSKETKQRRLVHKPKFASDAPPERKKMKMMDLIFWNPTSNPMKLEAPTAKGQKDDEQHEEEAVDAPDQLDDHVDNGPIEKEDEILPGPRLMIGEDGQIVIDETSLVIQQTAPAVDISKQEVVYETSDTTYASFKKPKRSLKPFWSLKETAKFYRALSLVGTDFTLMANIFPERTREDLKKKYKKEERTRQILVDKALSEWHNFDLEDYENFLGHDEIEKILTEAEKVKTNKRKRKLKNACDENGEPKKKGPPKRKKKKKDDVTVPWNEEDVEVEIPPRVEIDSDQETVELNNEDDEISRLKTRTTKRQIIIDEKKEMQAAVEAEYAYLSDSSTETLPYRENENEFNLSATPKSTNQDCLFKNPSVSSINKSPTDSLSKNPNLSSTPKSPTDCLFKTPRAVPTPVRARKSVPEKDTQVKGIQRLNSPEPASTSREKSATSPLTTPTNSGTLAKSSRDYSAQNRKSVISKNSTPNTLPSNTSSATPVQRAPNRTPDAAATPRVTQSESTPANPPKHPTLEAMLNEASSSLQAQSASGMMTPSANINLAVGKLVLVTSRTPSNEQVVHVYLVSPNPANVTPNATPAQPTDINYLLANQISRLSGATSSNSNISQPPVVNPVTSASNITALNSSDINAPGPSYTKLKAAMDEVKNPAKTAGTQGSTKPAATMKPTSIKELLTGQSQNLNPTSSQTTSANPNLKPQVDKPITVDKAKPTLTRTVDAKTIDTSLENRVTNISATKPVDPIPPVTPGRIIPKSSPTTGGQLYSSSIKLFQTSLTKNKVSLLPSLKTGSGKIESTPPEKLTVNTTLSQPGPSGAQRTYFRNKIQPNVTQKTNSNLSGEASSNVNIVVGLQAPVGAQKTYSKKKIQPNIIQKTNVQSVIVGSNLSGEASSNANRVVQAPGSAQRTYSRKKIQPNLTQKTNVQSVSVGSNFYNEASSGNNRVVQAPSPIFPKPSPSGNKVHTVKLPSNLQGGLESQESTENAGTAHNSEVKGDDANTKKTSLDQLGITKLN